MSRLDAPDETVIVDVTGVTNGIEATPQQVTATITDKNAPSISLGDDQSIREGMSGQISAMNFVVRLDGPQSEVVRVDVPGAVAQRNEARR